MKKILIIASLMLSAYAGTAQVENRCGSVFNAKTDSKIPVVKVNCSALRADKPVALPAFIDNTTNKYFPPIVSQIGGSCAQAAGVGYIYIYELNYLLDRDAKLSENNCSYMQMWNYLNDGVGNGSFTPDGWGLIKSNGVALSTDFKITKGEPGDKTKWLTGYDKYYRGMHNRVESIEKFVPYPDGPDKEYDATVITAMKRYLFDHNTGAAVGGLIQFTAFADPLSCDKNYLKDVANPDVNPSHTGYQAIISFFPKTGGHAMTFAGYDDAVEFDVNGDKVITEDEKGAFIAMNTWGDKWGDKGRFYVPYILLKLKNKTEGGTGTNNKNCYIVKPKITEPALTFKLTMNHTSRNDLSFKMGVKDATGNQIGEKVDVAIMSNAGGNYGLTGLFFNPNAKMEVGIDASELLTIAGAQKDVTYFIEASDKATDYAGKGEIIDCSLLDYRSDKSNPTEYIANINNPKLLNRFISTANMYVGKAKLEKDKTLTVDFRYSNASKKVSLSIVSAKETNISADLLNSKGVLIKNVFSNKVSSAGVNHTIDLKELKQGKYAIKIVNQAQVIYKIFKVQ